jgi:hypothetical protein
MCDECVFATILYTGVNSSLLVENLLLQGRYVLAQSVQVEVEIVDGKCDALKLFYQIVAKLQLCLRVT